MEKIRSKQASAARPEFEAKLRMAMALAIQLEQKLISWGKKMESAKESAAA